MDKILVVDDSPTFRKVMANLLKPLRCEVISAANGIEGIRQAVRHAPRFLTVDLEMPVLNGINMMKVLGLLNLAVPAIFITADESALEAAKKLPFVTAALHKSKLEGQLLDSAQALVKTTETRHYNDFNYEINHREFCHLLGERDRKRILVVEDSPALRGAMVNQLEKLRLFEVFSATDGHEGLLKALMIKPDLILSDIEMPKVDGLRLAQLLYILGHPFRLLYLSGIEDERKIQQARALEGVGGFFPKQEVLKDSHGFLQAIMQELHINADERARFQALYKNPTMDKLRAAGSLDL